MRFPFVELHTYLIPRWYKSQPLARLREHTVSLNDGSASLTFRNERSNSLDELTLQALTLVHPLVRVLPPHISLPLVVRTRENPSCEKEKDKRRWNKKIEFENKLGFQDVRAAKTKVLLSCKDMLLHML
ncbi:hypothetical protein CBL_10512 [Carabus blaptoides fortunei]